jgi:hypothetical protein
MKKLAKIVPLSPRAKASFDELMLVMPGIQYVRNNVVHAIVSIGEIGDDHVFELRSKTRSLTKKQIFSAEELTNYAARAVVSLRYALGPKDGQPAELFPLPDRPEIPKFLQALIPIHKKSGRQHRRRQQPSRA